MDRIVERIEPNFPKQPKLLRVAAYARVSSGKDAMLHSLSTQVSYYSNYIQKHPGWTYCGVYADEAITGTKGNRENFQRLLADCRQGKIDVIITKSISRFARNSLILLETVRELKGLGVDVFFEEQNIHTNSNEGELMLTILASYAQEESRSVSENMKWRIKQSFKEGRPWDCTILGYRFEGDGYVIEPNEASTVRLIFDLYLSGFGYGKIARLLNEKNLPTRFGNNWHQSNVARILQNDSYTGNLTLQKTFRSDYISKQKHFNQGELPKYRVEGSHEAIIPQEQFDRVQAEIKRRSTTQRQSLPSPFSRKLVCGICGRHYIRKKSSKGSTWVCYTYEAFGKVACASKAIPERILEAVVAEALATHGATENDFRDCVDHIDVVGANELNFIFYDGTSEHRTWKDPSRRDSWTLEMREAARQRAKNRWR